MANTVNHILREIGSTASDNSEFIHPSITNRATTQAEDHDGGYPAVFTLNIGGHKFQTMAETLRAESGLFHHQLSERFTWTAQDDGSYFLDADPELFGHLLRFMRRPEVFPLFYTKANGFDYDLYNRLEAEANYFQIDRLHNWIKDKQYLHAIVSHTYQADDCILKEVLPETLPINKTEERHYVVRFRKIYICPRQIDVHRGDPNRCGIACRKAQGDNEIHYEEEPYTTVIRLKKEVEFISGICKLK